MKQKIIDNVKSFIEIANENGIKTPVITMFGYQEKNDTMRLTFDYDNVVFLVDYHMDGKINLLIEVNNSYIKNNFVESKQELLEEILKCIQAHHIVDILDGKYLYCNHNIEA